ncbi:PH domain-containing protein [Lysobacter sp. D1-1-M9]|uniref:PH domain-containing protein n=1 Tax=Novilysobacter longmucuonensis TaxID=3098603 RepID=UPI002FC91BDA
MSWLFVLLAQLKQFVVPLVALFVFGRGSSDGNGWSELWPLIGIGVLVLLSLWQYFTYRYGVVGDALVVRQGLLERSLRVIPFARIHNVALQQSMLHRVFNVAEVRLESAGGQKPEAEMRVLKLADALALETLVRQRGHAAAMGDSTAADDSAPLLELPPLEVLKLGLISNRGLIVVGAVFAGLSQFSPRLIPNLFQQWGGAMFGWADQREFELAEYAIAATSLVALFVVALRLFSVLLALLQYYGFRLSEHGRRLTVERGLLARWRTSASRRRIQSWTLSEGVIHRLFKRRSLEVDTAVSENQNQQRALRELAPIGTPAACEALIGYLLPHAGWARLEWQPLPRAAFWRLFVPGALWLGVFTLALSWRFGAWGLLLLLWLPWSAYKARQHARRAGYALGEELVAVREGWWRRHWRFAEIDKLQALNLTRSPLDRRCGTATLWLDTAGAGAMSPPLRIRLVPHEQARAIYERLSGELARRPLRW